MLTLEYLKEKFELLKANPWQAILVSLVSFYSSYIMPAMPHIIALGVLIIFDFRTGIKKSRKNLVAITSNGWRRSLSKWADYTILLLASFLMESLVFKDVVPVLHIASGLCAVTEFKSIGENVAETTGNSKVLKIATYISEFIFPVKPKKPEQPL